MVDALSDFPLYFYSSLGFCFCFVVFFLHVPAPPPLPCVLAAQTTGQLYLQALVCYSKNMYGYLQSLKYKAVPK